MVLKCEIQAIVKKIAKAYGQYFFSPSVFKYT